MPRLSPNIDISTPFPHTHPIQSALKLRAAALHMDASQRWPGGRGVNIRRRVALSGAILFCMDGRCFNRFQNASRASSTN